MAMPMALRPLPDPQEIRYPERWPAEVAVVMTRGLKTWLESFPDVVEFCGIGAITGLPGTGKTTAACVGATMCGLPWGRVQIRRSLKLRELLRLVLGDGFEVPAPDSWNETRLQDELDRLLRGPGRVVIVDDAHLLPFEHLEFLRTSWTIDGNNCSLVLIGHRLDAVLDANGALDTRLEACVVFKPETTAQALVSVRAMHPFFAGASDELIAQIHQEWAGRRLRRWGILLRKALPGARRNGETALTERRYRLVRAKLATGAVSGRRSSDASQVPATSRRAR